MKHSANSIPASHLALPIPGRDHILGPTDAPVTLLEYGDYECPYCGGAHLVLKSILKEMGDNLCFAFRNFPLTNSHPHALRAAQTAEAAAAQGNFWTMHDLLFEHQGALEDEDLAKYAKLAGLDAHRLIQEVLHGVYVDRIQEDFKSGTRGGVNGTPTFFINGVRYDGAPLVEDLIAALNA